MFYFKVSDSHSVQVPLTDAAATCVVLVFELCAHMTPLVKHCIPSLHVFTTVSCVYNVQVGMMTNHNKFKK